MPQEVQLKLSHMNLGGKCKASCVIPTSSHSTSPCTLYLRYPGIEPPQSQARCGTCQRGAIRDYQSNSQRFKVLNVSRRRTPHGLTDSLRDRTLCLAASRRTCQPFVIDSESKLVKQLTDCAGQTMIMHSKCLTLPVSCLVAHAWTFLKEGRLSGVYSVLQ